MELTLFVDHQCNLRCRYCYTGEKFTRPMSAETMRKAVALALRASPDRLGVAFFGGEPLIHLDLVRETVEHVEQTIAALGERRPDYQFFMNTNATLIDERALELMRPPRRFTAFVSLDGRPEQHDRNRLTPTGKGSHAEVVAGLARLREADIPYQLLAVYGPETAPALGETVRALLELQPGKLHISANYAADWTDDSIAQLRQGLDAAGDAWMDWFRQGHALAIEPLHAKILSHLKGGMPCPPRCVLGGCEWTVTPKGNIYPCAQMVGEDTRADLVIGHVEQGIDLEGLHRLRKAKDRVEQTCAECELRDRCQSHCGCRHIALSGELGVITATLCEIEAALIAQADRVAETLYHEGCPTFIEYYYQRPWFPVPGGELSDLRRARDG
jgi:uncharacterized protein